MATANQMVDADTAEVIATDYGWKVERVGFEVEDYLPEIEAKPEDERPRPPVVTVMGHVDHGKTSLLDAIRAANVAAGEAGGITQHIGAYSVTTARGDITFLDTPGHEAFTSMRARGANVTDMVVLVVAADDGVMPQTVEAIKHAKAGRGAHRRRHQQDGRAGRQPGPREEGPGQPRAGARGVGRRHHHGARLRQDRRWAWTSCWRTSSLQAEVLELTSNPSRPAVGAIIEAKLDRGRGPVATVLVQEGTLQAGRRHRHRHALRPRPRHEQQPRRAGEGSAARLLRRGHRPVRRAHRG